MRLQLKVSRGEKQHTDEREGFSPSWGVSVWQIRKRMLKYVWFDLWCETYGKAMNNRWAIASIDLSVYAGFLLKVASSWIRYCGCKDRTPSDVLNLQLFLRLTIWIPPAVNYLKPWVLKVAMILKKPVKRLIVLTIKSYLVPGCFSMKLNRCSLVCPHTAEGKWMLMAWLQSH